MATKSKKKKAAKKAVKKAVKKAASKNKASQKKKSVKTNKKPSLKATSKKVTAKPKAKKSLKTQPSKKTSAPKTKASSIKKREGRAQKTPAKITPFSAGHRPQKIDWKSFFTPIDDNVLLELTRPAEKTAGGLYIPDMVQEKSNQGRVLAVGPGKRDKKGRRQPLDVQIGEKVMYADYAGSKLELDQRDLLLVKESGILGVLE